MSRTAVILLAAGSGRRMAGAVDDKVLAPLNGRPVFAHTAGAFAASGVADLYVIVYRDSRQMRLLSAWAPTPALLVEGGGERQESVMNALAALPSDIGLVFIHDCVRCLILPEQLAELHRLAQDHPAVVLAHRVTDTIKEAAPRPRSGSASRPGSRRSGRLRTLDRSRLWAMETPQVFARDLICRGYDTVRRRDLRVTDDAAAVELLGKPIELLENTHPNPKLTTPADLPYLSFLLTQKT